MKSGHIPSFVCIGITVIELRFFQEEEKGEENMDNMEKLLFLLIFTKCSISLQNLVHKLVFTFFSATLLKGIT